MKVSFLRALFLVALAVFAPSVAEARTEQKTCVTCTYFQVMEDTVSHYGGKIYEGTAASAKAFMSSLFFLWAMVNLFMYIFNQPVKLSSLAAQFVGFIMAGGVLAGYEFWKGYVLDPIVGMFVDWATHIARISGADTGGFEGLKGLAYAIETPPYVVIGPANGSFILAVGDNLARFVISTILVLIYAFIWMRAALSLVCSYIKFVVITALAPFTIALSVIPTTRPIFINSIKELIQGGLEIVTIAIYIGIVNHVMNGIRGNFPVDSHGGVVFGNAYKWLFSSDFWLMVFSGISLIVLHQYFAKVPSLLMNTVGSEMRHPLKAAAGMAMSAVRAKRLFS